MEWREISIRLCLATLAGMFVGIDRELRHKPAAGLRTHMLVTLSAASITLVGIQFDSTGASRVIQGIVTGIGFIGAGAILHSARHVEGVTTAASIWICTMIGVAAGAGYYNIMVPTLILTLIIRSACLALEQALRPADEKQSQPTGKSYVEGNIFLPWIRSRDTARKDIRS